MSSETETDEGMPVPGADEVSNEQALDSTSQKGAEETPRYVAEADEDVPDELAVDLPSYAGPLELLLELIRKHEIDIFDIPIALITEKYLGYIDTLEALDLQVGAEWLEMAAMLTYIKSRMLLPDDEDDDEEQGPDPRDELVRRLIEYQKYKLFAEKLDERPRLERDVFTHPPRSREFRAQTGPPELRPADTSDLMRALKRVIGRRGDDDTDWVVELTREKLSMRSVILEVARTLQDTPRISFESLFAGSELSRYRVVTTFLALLEMSRLNMIALFQSRMGEERLYIERAVIDILEVSQSLELSQPTGQD